MSDLHLHRHHDHSHAVKGGHSSQRKVGIAALVTFTFMFAEIAGGLISGSLALLADAAHMLTDAGSLALAWVGYALARRPADVSRTFGFSRFKVLAAFTNGLLLLGLGVWIVYEAVHRVLEPQPVLSGMMFWVAVAGLVVNVALFAMLQGGHGHHHGHDHAHGHSHDLNMKGALLHVLGDMLGSVAAIAAAIVIYVSGWTLIDPILSVFVALLLLIGAVPIIRRSAHILLQGTPDGVDLQQVADTLVNELDDVRIVHHVHSWTLTGEEKLITLHVVPVDRSRAIEVIPKVRELLKSRFGIDHATIELDVEPLGCDMGPSDDQIAIAGHTAPSADHR
ncbi:MAG: cation transporter [Ponticaulis sp.]|nr:cation transporter [Ponticaulis sp.]|tara:strand:+ start:16356 stop:17363 length:1008 start_codon:yes stop_codon:yes gene_type:complete